MWGNDISGSTHSERPTVILVLVKRATGHTSTANAPRKFPGSSQTGDLGKEMAGSQDVDEFGGPSEELPIVPTGDGAPATGRSSCEEQQVAGSEILPVEDRPLFRYSSERTAGPHRSKTWGAHFQELSPLRAQQKILRAELCQEKGTAAIGSSSMSFSLMSGIAGRSLTSLLLIRWRGGYKTRLWKMPRARGQRGKITNGKRRRRSWG
jgi:hypothetical protein